MTFNMTANVSGQGGCLMTYGEDSEGQMKSLYFKLNVLEKSGQLKANIKHANKFY